MSSHYERLLSERIHKEMGENLDGITPGLKVQVVHKGKLKADLALGRTYRYYDLASLTKILFTTAVFMRMADDKKISIQQSVGDLLGLNHLKKITIFQLLSHTSGFPWWGPFYKSVNLSLPREKRWQNVFEQVSRIRPKKRTKSVYSDVDFLFLAKIMETVLEQPLLEIWEELKGDLELNRMHFHPNNVPQYDRELYAPTEKCPWRKKILQGEVHDENTWAFGGVAPHAGLFAPIEDVTRWGLLLRQGYYNRRGSRLASYSAIRRFTRRSISVKKGDWGLGFMKPTRGSASCGRHFSLTSAGHTGFTGTSLWFDPRQDLLVVLLSNRVHPTRDNNEFVKYRPLIHDWICELL